MEIILIVLVGLAGFVVGLWLRAWWEAGRHGTSAAEEFSGMCVTVADRTVRKNANKDAILRLLEGGEMTNSDIRHELGISRRSVVRYMDQLEQAGQVTQVGDSGRTVAYRLNR